MILSFFKIIIYLLLFYIFYSLIRFLRFLGKEKKSSSPPKMVSNMMVKDEACNTYLPVEEAIKETIEGKEYYFCSEECRKKFLASRK